MYDFHQDKARYFQWQYLTSRDFIIPFIKEHVDLDRELKVLEIGCAEAGVLKAFTEKGHICTGIELSPQRVELAKEFMKEELEAGKIRFLAKDIYDIDIEKDLGYQFDLILLKDVIEHIPKQEVFIAKLKDFLAPGGKVFFGFPPWYMPFGGHQQIAKSKFLSKLPWYHLFPMGMYKWVLRTFKESPETIHNLEEIKETGISIERFEKIVKRENFAILKRKLWFTNPIYHFKFRMKPRKQSGIVAKIPWVRDFWSTAAYYVIGRKEEHQSG